MSPKIQNIPFTPDRHDQLAGIGTYSHDELDLLITKLAERVMALEGELIKARNARIQRHYVASMPEGVLEIEFPEGFLYTPGAHNLLFYGNFVKQVVGESYVEISPNKIKLLDPTIGGETFEFYAFPLPGLESTLP